MPQTTETLTDTLTLKDLRSFCASPGPCITVLFGAYHPGGLGSSHAARLKSAIPGVEQDLAKRSSPSQFIELLQPLRDLAHSAEMGAGGEAAVIFRSADVFRRFRLTKEVGDRAMVDRYFYIAPLLPQLCAERDFYILEVSRQDIHLRYYGNGKCEDVQIPDSVPKDVRAAGAFDAPDHDLENRSSAGKSVGSMKGVHFGTGSEREIDDERLFHFCRLVDKGLREVLNGKPLLLAGVEYEVATYRRAAKDSHLLKGHLAGDLRLMTLDRIGQLAYEWAQDDARKQAEATVAEFLELPHRERACSGIHSVLDAAGQGRVAKLILADGTEPGIDSPTLGSLNAAAVLTLSNGGQVFVLPATAMAKLAPAAAILRY